jgi:gas vesicle protein
MFERDASDRQKQVTSTLAWFLTGLVIGATAAVLYTPKTGRETRRYISRESRRGKEAVVETTENLVDAGRDMFERGRKLVEDAADLFERGRRLVRG